MKQGLKSFLSIRMLRKSVKTNSRPALKGDKTTSIETAALKGKKGERPGGEPERIAANDNKIRFGISLFLLFFSFFLFLILWLRQINLSGD